MGDLSYDDWADLLSGNFFRPENALQPVTLFVSDDLLASIVGETSTDEAVDSLVRALKSRLGSEARGDLFSAIVVYADDWQRSGWSGSAPSLPLLAAAVLAASRMAREGRIAEHNYYVRFRQLLRLPGKGQPDGYDWALPLLWQQLAGWMDGVKAGSLGWSTIRTHPTFHYIGYALSQALFRASDRHRLTHFFVQTGLEPGAKVDLNVLIGRLRAWATSGGMSTGAHRLIGDPIYEPMLRPLLQAVVDAWDGREVDDSGQRVRPIRLLMCLEPFAPPALTFVAQRMDGEPETVSLTDDSGTVEARSTVDGWYDQCSIEVSSDRLAVPWLIRGQVSAWRFKAGSVLPFRVDPVLGGWLTTDHATPDEESCLLVDSDIDEAARRYLRASAEPGWAPGELILGRWRLYPSVVTKPSAPMPGDARLLPLYAPLRTQIELHGGLPLAGSSGAYLVGGEPDVWLPNAASARQVVIDGTPIDAGAGELVVALSDAALKPGPHVVAVGEAKRRIDVATPPLEFDSVNGGKLGHCFASGQGVGEPRDVSSCPETHAVLAGADLRLPNEGAIQQQALAIPGGVDQVVVLGRVAGEIAEFPPWREPAWVRKIGLTPCAMEARVEFEPHVLLTKSARSWRVRLLRKGEPEVRPTIDDRVAVHQWAAWLRKTRRFRRDPGDAEGLAAYLYVAMEILNAGI
jgi:hypothetical protein